MNHSQYSLYLVTDRTLLHGRNLLTAIEEAIHGGVSIVQLREKNLSSREFYDLALQVKALTDQYRIPLIINDRIDIALACDAAGVHLGQQDLPAHIARQLLGPTKILGVSAHTIEEALQAVQNGANYLGVGAVFTTSTKLDAQCLTLDRLSQIKASVSVPVVAIGGINETNIHLLKNTGIDGVAVISAILGKEKIKDAANHLFTSFNNLNS